jgi:hypothetical protein
VERDEKGWKRVRKGEKRWKGVKKVEKDEIG